MCSLLREEERGEEESERDGKREGDKKRKDDEWRKIPLLLFFIGRIFLFYHPSYQLV